MHSILHMKYFPTFTKDLRNWHRSIFYAWSIWAYHTCTYCIQFIWKLIQQFPNLWQQKAHQIHHHNTQPPPLNNASMGRVPEHRWKTHAKSWFLNVDKSPSVRFSVSCFERKHKDMSPKWLWKMVIFTSHGIESDPKTHIQTNICHQNDGFSRKAMLVDPRSDMSFQEPCDGISTNLPWVKRVGYYKPT